MDLVIIAGGKGTRLGLTTIPKPMAKIDGVPLLERQIILAKRYGIQNIYILSGHLSEVIIDHCGNGDKWGVNIHHVVEKEALGTAGAIRQLKDIITSEFIVFYGDTLMDVNLDVFQKYALNKGGIASIMIHPNNHPYDSDLVEIDDTDEVTKFHAKPHIEGKYYSNLVNAALYIFSPKIFDYIEEGVSLDFGKDIFPSLVGVEKIYGYRTTEYVKDMGTPERILQTESALVSGKVAKLNISNKQKAVFIDRDGVINKEVDCLSNIENFEILPGVVNALKKLNKSDYITILVTNQPVIAKGFITEEELLEIHKKMETELGAEGAFLDDIYYCPHHQEKGFEGEIPELKIDCNCRKPKSGMLEIAADKYNIDLSNSWIIGDRYADIQAGKGVNSRAILVKTGHAGNDKEKFEDLKEDYVCSDLEAAVNVILKGESL